jgi:polyisoprenoid-binding protein YceI
MLVSVNAISMTHPNKKMKPVFVLLLLFSLSQVSFSQENQRVTGYKVKFSIKNAGITVNGSFNNLSAQFRFDPVFIEKSYISASIRVDGLSTGINSRDRHLMNEDYFYKEKFPALSMISKRFYRKENQIYADFELKIRDVSKIITIPVNLSKSGSGTVLSSSFKINRLDFKIGESSWILSDEVQVEVEAVVEI